MRTQPQQKSKNWTSKSLASDFFHRIFYVAIRLGGRGIAYFMLFFVVLFYSLLPAVSRKASYYINRRFRGHSFFTGYFLTFRLFWNFGLTLVDRAVMGILNSFTMEATKTDMLTLQILYNQKKRLILITGHVGCWQLGLSGLDYLDAPKAVVMFKDRKDVDKQYYEHQKKKENEVTSKDVTIIRPDGHLGGTLEMLQALNNNSILCINADRTFGSSKGTVNVPFLGGQIPLPVSAYKLAAVTQTPIAITFSHRTGAGRGNYWIADVIEVPRKTGTSKIRGAQAFKPYAETYARCLEQYSRKHPFQFFNFYNMWQ